MKKLYTLLLLIGISVFTYGQTFVYEDFSDNQMPPTDWTIDGLSNQWSINNGNEAGGIAPEGKFSYTQGTHTTRLISPEVDLSGLSTVNLSFTHYYDDYSGTGPVLGVATRAGGGDWNMVWEINPNGNVGPEELTIEINNGDVGQADFQFCFYLDGNMYNIDYWYVDNIWLFQPLNLDLQLRSINVPTYVSGETEVLGTVKNIGNDQINSFDVNWSVEGGEVFTTPVSGLALDFGDTYDFMSDQLFNYPIGSYDLTVLIDNVNGGTDEDPSNNELTKDVNVVSNTVYRRVCFEEFTSSTCPPCATLNEDFVPWCYDHADEITLLKYQMNWPGSGDPYYTAEGGVRKDYYGVSGVPAVFVNGTYIGYQFGGVQPAFDQAVLQPGLLDIASSHSLDGTEMTINANIVPFADFPQHRVYIGVFEYLTTGNVGSNGETEFEHVMMKMVPDAEGTIVDFTDRDPVAISETVDLSGTFIEEWDDLGVIVFIQDYDSKEIFQSDYSMEDAVYSTDATLSDLTYDGVTVPGFDPGVFEYNIELPEGTTEVPLVLGTPNLEAAMEIVVPATELPGTTIVDVFAEDRYTKNTYTINFTIATGINKHNTSIRIFPNPATEHVYIKGLDVKNVSVFNVVGELVLSNTNPNPDKVYVGNLDTGLYLMQVELENGEVVSKKISIK